NIHVCISIAAHFYIASVFFSDFLAAQDLNRFEKCVPREMSSSTSAHTFGQKDELCLEEP
uniref:Uncharacterized protein n=1 Tax=Caenorhabditis japonica TaxID=281687 RepID=A0A8R1IEZ5_CAEJA